MRILIYFSLIVLTSCSGESLKYEMIQFGKTEVKVKSNEAIYIKVEKENKVDFLFCSKQENIDLHKVLVDLGKGDKIKLTEKVGSFPKETEIELIDFIDIDYLGTLKEGIKKLKGQEKVDLIQLFCRQEESFEYVSGVYISPVLYSDSGKKGEKNSIYRVEMECELLDGKKVYSTVASRTLLEFNKSMPGQVTVGLALVMDMMEEGDEVKAVIPSNLSFGEKGIEGLVPPNSPLIYKLKLIEIII